MSDNVKYKVSYLVTGSSSVINKLFDSFEEASEFSLKVPTGNVLEIKRVENAS